MLKQILQAYRTHRVMSEVEDEVRDMIHLAKVLYHASSLALLEQKEVEFDLYAKDREINNKMIEVRKKIVRHLTLSGTNSIGGSLVFLKVITDPSSAVAESLPLGRPWEPSNSSSAWIFFSCSFVSPFLCSCRYNLISF